MTISEIALLDTNILVYAADEISEFEVLTLRGPYLHGPRFSVAAIQTYILRLLQHDLDRCILSTILLLSYLPTVAGMGMVLRASTTGLRASSLEGLCAGVHSPNPARWASLDVRFISSLSVMQRSAGKVWADTRPVQILWVVRSTRPDHDVVDDAIG